MTLTFISSVGRSPVGEKDTLPEIVMLLLGATQAPLADLFPSANSTNMLSGSTCKSVEKRHRNSGSANQSPCPARSTTSMSGSLLKSPSSGKSHPSLKSI